MPIYNLIEYSNNYSDTSGSLWQFKRDEAPINDNGNHDIVTTNNSSSFKNNQVFRENQLPMIMMEYLKNTKIVVPLKYLSNFWRSLEMPLGNCKIHLELN